MKALERASYSRTDVLVLDDVFSALDASTLSKISQALLGRDGILRSMGMTAIVATHSGEPKATQKELRCRAR